MQPAAAPTAVAAAAAGAASPVTQPPRKRGRPKGSKNAPLGERLWIRSSVLGIAVLWYVLTELCDRSGFRGRQS